jgi:hypothetical protein
MEDVNMVVAVLKKFNLLYLDVEIGTLYQVELNLLLSLIIHSIKLHNITQFHLMIYVKVGYMIHNMAAETSLRLQKEDGLKNVHQMIIVLEKDTILLEFVNVMFIQQLVKVSAKVLQENLIIDLIDILVLSLEISKIVILMKLINKAIKK